MHTTFRLPSVSLSAATLLLLSACSGAPAPTLELDRVEVVAADFVWVESEAVFTVRNPRPLQTELRSFSYALELAGLDWLEGEGVELLQVSGAESGELRLPLGISTAAVFEEQRPSRGSDTLPARFSAAALLVSGDQEVRLDVQEELELLTLRPPTIEPVSMAVEERDDGAVELIFDLVVDNDLGTEVSLSAAELVIAVDGVPVVSEPFETATPLAPATAEGMELRTTLDPSAGGAPLVDALAAGVAVISVDAALVVETVHGSLPHSAASSAELRF